MKTDVLIVGAGPTGLALACQLTRFGIDSVIIDKKETTTPYSKAIGVHARTLEIYEQIGLAGPLIALGDPAEKVRLFAGGSMRGDIELIDIGKGMSPYPYLLVVEQGRHERLLYDHIRTNGHDVLWLTELVSFQNTDDGVTAHVRSATSDVRMIEAKYLVGCDGAKSFVRNALGLKFEGTTFERMFYVADVRIDWEFGHDALQVFLMRNSLLAFFPMRGEKQFRIVGTFPEEFTKDEGDVLYEEIEQQIKHDADIELDITGVNWFSTYKVHTRHVNKFSIGRCFLAGDAAHIHTPAGAQGMNTGIQDGYNLAWKLALVLKYSAPRRLLETYNEERLPNAQQLVRTTDRFFMLGAGRNKFLAFVRMWVFPYVAGFLFSLDSVKRFVFPRVSQIAINYRSSSLGKTLGRFNVRAGDRMPWFEIEGASIYDRLREPVFHLLVFFEGKTEVPPLPDDLLEGWNGMIDSTVISLSPKIREIFGTKKSFYIILRPDNYVGMISDDFDPEQAKTYLHLIMR